MGRYKIYWICQIVGWSLNASFNLILFTLDDGDLSAAEIQGQVLTTLYFIFSTHIYRNLIIRWGWLRMLSPKLIPRIILSVLLLTISCFIFELMLVSLGISVISEDVMGWVVVQLFGILFLYFIWSLIYFVYHYFENYKTALKYKASMNEIQLNRLKSQLNPHFIFNGLNSIRALIDEDPGKAKMAVTQLSNILRNTLGMNEKKLIKFGEELKTVRDYLDLENVRYEERLQTVLDIHPDSYRFTVPPLMVQTLVENGIKHGIANLVEGGILKLSTYVDNGEMKIEIRNSGHYENGQKGTRAGYGIANTVQRLNLLYGDKAKFKIFNEGEKFVVAEVTIPEQVNL